VAGVRKDRGRDASIAAGEGIDAFRDGVHAVRDGIDTFRDGIDPFRDGIDASRNRVDVFRDRIDAFREGIDVFREDIDVFREGIDAVVRWHANLLIAGGLVPATALRGHSQARRRPAIACRLRPKTSSVPMNGPSPALPVLRIRISVNERR